MSMNTILAFATGYQVEQYVSFLNSLKTISTPFKVVLFTDLIEDDFLEWSFCEVINIKQDGYKDINPPVIAAVIRYYFYQKYLTSSNVTGIVLFCDVRDVVFQNGDVFNNLSSEKIYVFKENNRYTFGKCECHNNWFNTLGRSEFTIKFFNDTFYCSGVQLFGGVDSCLSYLTKFIEQCEHYINYTFYINDQPLHNILIYENHFDDNVLVKYDSEVNDKVFNMGLCKEEDYVIQNKVLSYTVSKKIPSIVHQYDRRLGRTKELL